MKIIILFTILSVINVVFSTIRSLATINCGKYVASIVNAGYFAFYNIILIYSVADFALWQKCVITFVCNLIGVFVVKLIEEKMRKDRLWKIEATIKSEWYDICCCSLDEAKISFSIIETTNDKYSVFNIYCPTQKESARAKEILTACEAKYFVSESKAL